MIVYTLKIKTRLNNRVLFGVCCFMKKFLVKRGPNELSPL